MRNLRDSLLEHFSSVRRVKYVGTEPDDWRKPLPTSFNCSSFLQWIALRTLGWSAADKAKRHPPNVRALLNEFSPVDERQISVGDALIYVGVGPRFEIPEAMHTMLYIGDEEVIGACDEAGEVVRRPAAYRTGWQLRFARRISRL